MFNYKAKPISDEVVNHWIASADDFNFSSVEFYERINKRLAAMKIPDLHVSQEEHAEGGMLSAKRIYLRLLRDRMAFEICAAPFGTRYFFSCRTIYSPRNLTIVQIIIALAIAFALFALLVELLGLVLAVLGFAAIVITTVVLFNTAAQQRLSDVDAVLAVLPGLGPIYERFFHKETYYRHDTRLMFLDTIPSIVQAEADEITAAKGVRLVREYQTSPILGELYKPMRKAKPAEE